MIRKLVDKVARVVGDTADASQDPAAREKALQLATAVLVATIARADNDFADEEFDLFLRLIEKHFDLSPQEALELVERADDVAEETVSLHGFTQELHKNLTEREKERIVALLWQIGYADGRLDKYENSLVLKISDLLYVSRGRVMRLKHDAELAAGVASD